MSKKMTFRSGRSRPHSGPSAFLPRLFSPSILFMFMSVLSAAMAYDMEVDNRAYNSRQFRKLEKLGQIHFDQRQPPTAPGLVQRRQVESSTTSSKDVVTSTDPSSPSTTSTVSLASEAQTTTTQVTTTMASATIITTPVPVPFDTSLGSNFTSQSCPDFFNTFLANSTFKSCSPISLLLQNSNSFFQAERDATLLSETLDIACNAPLAICSPLMSSLSQELISTTNCGADYDQQNPLVMQAYNGMVAYEPIYRATCLKNPESGSYCFSEAITNASAPADSYPYYTALGLTMPTSSRPTCDKCLQNTMAIFAGYAADSNQPLASTYTATSYQIDLGCGPTFVNTTVAVAVTGAASSSGASIFVLLALLLATIALVL